MIDIYVEAREANNNHLANLLTSRYRARDFGTVSLKGIEANTNAAAFVRRLIEMILVGQQVPEARMARDVQILKESFCGNLTTMNFRREVRNLMMKWTLLQAKLKALDLEGANRLVAWTSSVCDLALSPMGEGQTGSLLLALGNNNLVPIRFSQSQEWPTADSDWIDCYSMWPNFLGFFDFLDQPDIDSVVEILPEVFVEPGWYSADRNDVQTDYTDLGADIFDTLFKDHQTLQQSHRIKVGDGFCEYIDLVPLKGVSPIDGWYSGLAAAITYEGTLGGDIYLVLQTEHLNDHNLLMGQEQDDGVGPSVILRIYEAVAEAMWEETGELVQIDEVRAELGEL
ncbi:hypothetical protein [Alicyclobacillus sp. SO9]|uniref:hypothetical protein n=1 Tax=Alicyclobacillus sp. SO9 TaxID=2665646 RepID=UPI0018E6F9F4|nr:hypothetical protein [Alicyclobacillus sp. SO9]QQE77299.1 hypothetical protein GI364_15175 [Alicyclobacillus sp. SO9]